MAFLEKDIPLEIWQSINIDTIIKSSRRSLFQEYAYLLSKKSEEESDDLKRKGLMFISAICSLKLSPDTPECPYVPSVLNHHSKSLSIDLLDELDFANLGKAVAIIESKDMIFRISDLLWIKVRNYDYAVRAIDSYIAFTEKFHELSYKKETINHMDRLIQIALSTGRNSSNIKKVVGHVNDLIDKYGDCDPVVDWIDLIELLVYHNCHDKQKHLGLIENYAIRARALPGILLELKCWEIFREISEKDDDDNNRLKAYSEQAQAYIREAEACVKDGRSYMGASSFIFKAIATYRKSGEFKDEINNLRPVLLDYQKLARNEMQPIAIDIDIRDMIDKAEKHVCGYDLSMAIIKLTDLGGLLPVEKLKEKVIESSKIALSRLIFTGVSVDERGRTKAIKPPIRLDCDEGVDITLMAEMWSEASRAQFIQVMGYIQPAIRKINEEHHVTLRDIYGLIQNSSFIPPGRCHSFSRGLLAGFHGDHIAVGSILIPQIENSLRYHLDAEGIETTTLSNEGIQYERSLSDLFYDERGPLERIFGKSNVFYLQGLLVEEFGDNLRNRVAHGLMEDAEFYSTPISYLWWITFRLCCDAHLHKLHRAEETGS